MDQLPSSAGEAALGMAGEASRGGGDPAFESLPQDWVGRLGVLGRLESVRRAAATIHGEIGSVTTRFYAEDLAGLAARAGVPYKDLLVAADLLASDKLIHYPETPDRRIDERTVMKCEVKRLRIAYVIRTNG